MRRLGLIAGVICILLGVALLSTMLWFKWASHSVAARMQEPILHFEDRPAADIAFQTLDGTSVHLSDMKGKVVFLDLWGTWCVQCVAEMPRVQKLYDHFKSDPRVQFLIISRMDSEKRVQQYALRNQYTLPFYVMRDENIPESMRLNQFPSTFLYNKDGRLVAEHVGAADWAAPSVLKAIQDLER